MNDDTRIDDLARIDPRRVTGVDDDVYVLAADGRIWRNADDVRGSWVQLPPFVQRHPMAVRLRAVDIYMHASRYDGHDSDSQEHHKFELRALDHQGGLWSLRFVYPERIWDEVPL